MKGKLALTLLVGVLFVLVLGCPKEAEVARGGENQLAQVSQSEEVGDQIPPPISDSAQASTTETDQPDEVEGEPDEAETLPESVPSAAANYTVSDEQRDAIQEMLAAVYAKLNWVAPRSEEAYVYALNEPEWLEKVPCWCGCARLGHISNRECFITNEGELDPHGAGCKVCVDIALVTRDLLAEGLSIGEIRKLIDEQYSSWGVPSTPTPYYDS